MDESLVDCLKREVLEETALAISEYRFFGVFSDPSRIVRYPDGNVFRILTLAFRVPLMAAPEMRPSAESKDLRMVPHYELRSLDIVETHKHILETYLHHPHKVYVQ